MDNVGIVVEDLAATIEFFRELGLEREGRALIEGEWSGRVTGLGNQRVETAMMRTPDGHSRLELAIYRDFMGWEMPWYSAQSAVHTLLAGRQVGHFYLVCYVRHDDRVFETYWTTGRGVEVMGNSNPLLDLTIYGRQERWEDSTKGWPQPWGGVDRPDAYRINGLRWGSAEQLC
jgi:predicted dithiol-disulfide oxidoreductase (DUF899 family)